MMDQQFKECLLQSWRDSPVVKCTCYSCKRLVIDSQHPHCGLQLPITLEQGIKCPLLSSVGTTRMQYINIYATTTLIHKIKLKKIYF